MKILNGIREACEEYADVSSYANIRILIDTHDFSVFCDVPSNYTNLCIDLSKFANIILKKLQRKRLRSKGVRERYYRFSF